MASYMEYLTGLTGIKDEPKPINLGANNLEIYPNPFAATTNIQWNNPLSSKTNIKIYNQSGRIVKKLINRQRLPNRVGIQWDGKDDFGRVAKPGVYFVRFSTGASALTKTIIKTD
jgi:hypothetical protein